MKSLITITAFFFFSLVAFGELSREEIEVKTHVVELLREYELSADVPLVGIEYETEKKEWVLVFDRNIPDGGFTVFIKDNKTKEISLMWAGTNWYEKYPKPSHR